MSDEVKLEPPKRPMKLAGVVAAIVLLAGATVVAIVWAVEDKPSAEPAEGRVKIEVRAMPAMEIQLDGRKLGTTPLTFVVPRSDKPVRIDASYMIKKYSRVRVLAEPHHDTRMVVPDRDRTIDFSAKR